MVAAVVWATLRNARKASMTERISGLACATASSNRLLQLENVLGRVFDFVQIMRQRGFQRELSETHMRLDPIHVLLGPGFYGIGQTVVVTQWKLSQPVAPAKLIFLSCFACSHSGESPRGRGPCPTTMWPTVDRSIRTTDCGAPRPGL